MELTPWKIPHGTYTMEVTSQNFYYVSLDMEHTHSQLPSGPSTAEIT